MNFDLGPCNTFFDLRDGTKISVAKYFYKTYNLKITDKRQPLLVVRTQGYNGQIPSEFCLIDGVPDSIRSNPNAMRTLLGKVKQTPQQKLDAIQSMMRNLFKMKKWEEWDITIDKDPQTLESRKLAVPELIHKEGDDQKLFACERLLKQMPVFSSEVFEEFDLLLIFDRYSRNEAESARTNFRNCQKGIQMRSGDFRDLELPDCRGNFNKLNDFLSENLQRIKKQQQKDKKLFAVIILEKKTDYAKFKSIFTRENVMTQVVTKFTARKMNLSIATNVMKQINSKMGGESIRIKYPDFMNKNNVMIIGIDVCHAGKKSVVGFVATNNESCTSAYSDIIIQPKCQELVTKDLDKCMYAALQSYASKNGNVLPDKIIIYRDGVGEGMFN